MTIRELVEVLNKLGEQGKLDQYLDCDIAMYVGFNDSPITRMEYCPKTNVVLFVDGKSRANTQCLEIVK